MAITAADVKKLRDQTGAGMMDAKNALVEADGDFEKATELLRISGAVKAAKRSDREASNGLVAAAGKADYSPFAAHGIHLRVFDGLIYICRRFFYRRVERRPARSLDGQDKPEHHNGGNQY